MNTNTDLQEGLNIHRKAGKLKKYICSHRVCTHMEIKLEVMSPALNPLCYTDIDWIRKRTIIK